MFRSLLKLKIKKEILNLDISKACQDSNIPTKIIKANANIFPDLLNKKTDRSLETDRFASYMTLSNKTCMYKESSQPEKGNYCPVRISVRILYLL